MAFLPFLTPVVASTDMVPGSVLPQVPITEGSDILKGRDPLLENNY